MTEVNTPDAAIRSALVIDDEAEIAEFVADVLELCGFNVDFVCSAAAAHQ